MSLFRWWSKASQADAAAETKVRQSARELVANGRISLDEAKRAVTTLSSLNEMPHDKRQAATKTIAELANRGSFDRGQFKQYDQNGVLSCDRIFIEELQTLMTEFETAEQANLESMPENELRSQLEAATSRAGTVQQVLDRRFPKSSASSSSPPSATASSQPWTRRRRTEAEIKAEAAQRWASHQKNPNSFLMGFHSLDDFERYLLWQEQN